LTGGGREEINNKQKDRIKREESYVRHEGIWRRGGTVPLILKRERRNTSGHSQPWQSEK
jgi:hypothetical protein